MIIVEDKVKVSKILIFELKSMIGRGLHLDRPKLCHGLNYLHLGCGNNYLKGYVNADFFSKGMFKKNKTGHRLEWYLDMRYPLRCNDSVFDGVYTEHTIEHLYPGEVYMLMRELYRVMKKGAVIRITVPDLERYIKYYNGQIEDEILSKEYDARYGGGCVAIRNMAQNYSHLSLWDYNCLANLMNEIGFKEVKQMSYCVTGDKRLCLDKKNRSWETLYLEALR